MNKQKHVYVHEITGNIIEATPVGARLASSHYKRVVFGKNDKGEPIMKLPLRGATVTITEQEAVQNGNRSTK